MLFSHKLIKRTNSRGGFTLFEMMIVIAIIGLLTAVVVGGTQLSRSKAKLLETSYLVGEYITAITALHIDTGEKPNSQANTSNCLGSYDAAGPYDADECSNSIAPRTVNAQFTADLLEFFPEIPKGNPQPYTLPPMFGGITVRGSWYEVARTNPATGEAVGRITYMVEGQQECNDIVPGSTLFFYYADATPSDITVCLYHFDF